MTQFTNFQSLTSSNLTASHEESKEAAATLARAREAVATAPEVEIRLMLKMRISDIKRSPSDFWQSKYVAFSRIITRDIANAIHGKADHVLIERATGWHGFEQIGQDTVGMKMILETGVCGDDRRPSDAAQDLQEQVGDPKSKLMLGRYVFLQHTRWSTLTLQGRSAKIYLARRQNI